MGFSMEPELERIMCFLFAFASLASGTSCSSGIVSVSSIVRSAKIVGNSCNKIATTLSQCCGWRRGDLTIFSASFVAAEASLFAVSADSTDDAVPLVEVSVVEEAEGCNLAPRLG